MQSQFNTQDLTYDRSTPDIFGAGGIDYALKPFSGVGKNSFLVFRHNKYITIPTKNIAFFYIKYETPMIVGFDGQEYSVNYSLKQLESLVTEKQFYRLNKQYLINFDAVKEVEHYFARKLLVKLTVDAPDQLLVAKEKARAFLGWLENR